MQILISILNWVFKFTTFLNQINFSYYMSVINEPSVIAKKVLQFWSHHIGHFVLCTLTTTTTQQISCKREKRLLLVEATFFCLNEPFPASFFFVFIFSIQLIINNIQCKFFRWRDSNCRPLASEATLYQLSQNHISYKMVLFLIYF